MKLWTFDLPGFYRKPKDIQVIEIRFVGDKLQPTQTNRKLKVDIPPRKKDGFNGFRKF